MDSETADPRCPWCLSTERYQRYHDEEWGLACTDERSLFELLNLEGAQAGLSWITILNKRERYRQVFKNFEPRAVARLTDRTIERLVTDPGIVRHRGKIRGVVTNARSLLAMHEQGESLAELVWGFVDATPVDNRYATMAEVPGSTPASIAMSRELKRRGFTFVGPTICYAFMQAAGLVNDHLLSCPGHARVIAARA